MLRRRFASVMLVEMKELLWIILSLWFLLPPLPAFGLIRTSSTRSSTFRKSFSITHRGFNVRTSMDCQFRP